jgi:translocation and assembly module TamB
MKLRWHHWTLGTMLLMAIAAGAVLYAIHAGIVVPWVRRELISQLEMRTGARVELGGLRVDVWRLRAQLDDLTLHGTERATEPPLFHADRVNVDLRVVSLLRRRIALDELIVARPEVYVRYDAKGHSNLPTPKVAANGRPWNETLFDLMIGRLELSRGAVRYNDQRTPLDARGENFAFKLQYAPPAGEAENYVGSLSFQSIDIAAQKDVPFRAGLSAKFTLHRTSFDLDELICQLPHSELNLRAEIPNLALPEYSLHYRGRLSLADVRTIFRQPAVPDATAEFSGDARVANGDWTANGYFDARDITMKNVWFHEAGIEALGNYTVAQRKLAVPNLHVNAFAGTVDGKLDMNLDNLSFRTETHLRGDSLAAVFAALNNPQFPVNPLHWDAAMSVDSVNTWTANFQHFRTVGTSTWIPPATLRARLVPISAQIAYDYSQDTTTVTLKPSEISSPRMKIDFDGTLGGSRSDALNAQFHANDLLEWDEFINKIRGPDATEAIAGQIAWQGRILGNITDQPRFVGRFQTTNPRYGRYAWDELSGDMEYSPSQLQLTNTTGKLGGATIGLSLSLQFDGSWGFTPDSTWALDAQLRNAPSKDVQDILDSDYPVTGMLTGSLHGSGTQAAPQLDSNFTFDQVTAKGFSFDRLSGQFHWQQDEVRLSNAELTAGAGQATGNLLYRPDEEIAEFDIAGAGISLDKIEALQTKALPISGQFTFSLKGSGPVRAPVAQGELRIANLKSGSEVEGDFRGQLKSDGRDAKITFASDLQRGKLDGQLDAQLQGDFPLSGKFSVEQFDLDPLIKAGLHLDDLTGHSSANGTITLSGSLRRPESIEADADISSISFAYQAVQLANDGNVKLSYTKNEIRVDQARLHGTGTDLQIGGSARFDGDRPLRLNLSGTGDLRLLGGLFTDLEAQGQATVNVAVGGTMERPQITGRAGVHDASMNYADFPVGLSNVNGDFVFDQSRLIFNGLTADSGGGTLKINGSMTYGDGPIRYDVNATTTTVRIRYPTGMSWLAAGALRFAGTSDASVLSGTVNVQHLLFAEGVDVASIFAASSENSASPPSTSPFLRNLTFDVAGRTTPGARIEWGGAQIDMDGDVRLRGSWDHPVILGHVHLLGGEMAFRGNNYQLSRGDINFANPFRLDPVLNIEATTTISQYQVTIDFSGPSSRLGLNYRSDPPLPDSDIVALLALGNTGESNALMTGTGAASQNYGATALLSEAISSGLGGRIEHLFGISHFSVDPFVAGTAAESNAAARVTIQQQVKNNLTITYSTNAATNNQYQLIQVEYSIRRDLSVVFLRDINGTYGMDIKWVKRLK